MNELTLISRIILYVLLAVMGLFALLVWFWQFGIARGKAFRNPDGSYDDWHAQKCHFGIALADVVVACPLNLLGIALVFIAPRWGCYLVALVSFWWVWANFMTTANSLRFEKPKITFLWFITFPFGFLVGLSYIAWSVANFDAIYCR